MNYLYIVGEIKMSGVVATKNEFDAAVDARNASMKGGSVSRIKMNIMKGIGRLEESLTVENKDGKINKKKVFWIYNQNDKCMNFVVPYGSGRIGEYKVAAATLADGLAAVKSFCDEVRTEKGEWNNLIQSAEEISKKRGEEILAGKAKAAKSKE